MELNLENTGKRKDLKAAFSRNSHSNFRDAGWCIILQAKNTSSQLSSSFLHNLRTQQT